MSPIEICYETCIIYRDKIFHHLGDSRTCQTLILAPKGLTRAREELGSQIHLSVSQACIISWAAWPLCCRPHAASTLQSGLASIAWSWITEWPLRETLLSGLASAQHSISARDVVRQREIMSSPKHLDEIRSNAFLMNLGSGVLQVLLCSYFIFPPSI